MHGLAHVGGLLIVDLIVFRAVDAKEGRHAAVDGGDRSKCAEFGKAGLIELIRAEEVDAASVGSVAVDGIHIEALRMIAAEFCELSIIDGPVEIDHSGYFGFRRFVGPCVVDKQSAGRFSNERNFRCIDVVFGGVCLHPVDRAVDIRNGLREVSLRRKTVIDTEPGESSVREWLKQRSNVCALAAAIKATAVDENGSGKWSRSVWNVKVEQYGLTVPPGVCNIFLVERRANSESGAGEREDENGLLHGGELYQSGA